MSASVPFLDLSIAERPLLPELLSATEQVLRHGAYVSGPEVGQLEQALAAYVGVNECVSCSSGTTALLMALIALDIGPGDEVIVPAYTFAAPLEVVLLRGATPVLADIEPATCLIDVTSATQLIGPRTKAIIAVSLYGQPADFTALESLAEKNGLYLIEDAAQSFGAQSDGRRSGAFGHLSCTSFYPTKPLGGCGDGGAVLTRDPALASVLRQIRDHGQAEKYQHTRLGLNGRLDTLSCAALLVKLRHFPAQLARREQLAARYATALARILPGDCLPRTRPGASSSHALYCIAIDERDAVRERLALAGIGTAVHYPTPLHRQPAFADSVRWTRLAESERAAQRGLCLPLFPGLTDQQQDRVMAALAAATQPASC
jgi:UDP-2-acetamido-2-deoxy-ribo-hexuluronate aminotransferase